MNFFIQKLDRITGPVSELQIREIAAEFAWLNLSLKERPTFRSEYDRAKETIEIKATRAPKPELNEMDHSLRGELMERALSHAIPKISILNRSAEELKDLITRGRLSFLFDNDGKFIIDGKIS